MTNSDSDSDSFHSASEGEYEAEAAGPAPIAPAAAALPKKERASDADVASPHHSKDSSSSLKSDTTEEDAQKSPDEGWGDFGEDEEAKADEADDEGGDNISVKAESDDSETFHRQSLDRERMPPPSGFFDWSAINNVVSSIEKGISNVVETGLGIPGPEEFAQLSVAERRKILQESQDVKEPEPSLSSDEGGCNFSPEGSLHGFTIRGSRSSSAHPPPNRNPGGFGGIFGGFGSIVNGGLDVLESLGKKTFETLTVKDEADKRRFILQPEREQNLSDILREIRESEECSPPSPTKFLGYGTTTVQNSGISFLREFENFNGLVYLEGFELLSRDYFADKVADKTFHKFDEHMQTFVIEDVSECNSEDFLKAIRKQVAKFNTPYDPAPIFAANETAITELSKITTRVDQSEVLDVEQFHRAAVVTLANLTAKTIECLCRLVQQMIVTQSRPEIEVVFAFTYLVCRRLSFFASQYANLLSLIDQNSKVEEAVTNIFYECSNACFYLKKALELCRPFYPDDGFLYNPTIATTASASTSKSASRSTKVEAAKKPPLATTTKAEKVADPDGWDW